MLYNTESVCVSNALSVREFIPTIPKCVTFTDDLEIQGQIILNVISENSHISSITDARQLEQWRLVRPCVKSPDLEFQGHP